MTKAFFITMLAIRQTIESIFYITFKQLASTIPNPRRNRKKKADVKPVKKSEKSNVKKAAGQIKTLLIGACIFVVSFLVLVCGKDISFFMILK